MRALSTKVPVGAAARAAASRSAASSIAEQRAADLVLEVAAHHAELHGARHGAADVVRGRRRSRPRGPRSRARRPRPRSGRRARASCRGPAPRRPGRRSDQAMPALVVAMAGKPTCSRIRAEPGVPGVGEHEARTRGAARGTWSPTHRMVVRRRHGALCQSAAMSVRTRSLLTVLSVFVLAVTITWFLVGVRASWQSVPAAPAVGRTRWPTPVRTTRRR